MNKKLLITCFALALFGVGIYVLETQYLSAEKNNVTPAVRNTVAITASFYPVAHFAQQVGKEYVTVTTITPAGAEPHDYEPTSGQIASVYDSNLLIVNGSGLEPWAEKIKPDLRVKNIATLTMSESFDLLKSSDAELATDPHIWLDPALAIQEVEIIRDELIKIDPAHRSAYQNNAEGYITELIHLDQRYTEALAYCTSRDIVTSHAAFGYLAKHYNLNQIAISGISPDEEPSSQRMADVAKIAKDKNIRYIFFETLVSPKLADTIAREIGAQTAVFNPLEGLTKAEMESGKTYSSVMQENLNNITSALQCT